MITGTQRRRYRHANSSVVRHAALALLVTLAVLAPATGLIAAPQGTRADHGAPVATFSVDVRTADNTYTADPDSDGSPDDNKMAVPAVHSCVEVEDTGRRTIDIVGSDMRDVTAYDIRLTYDPDLAAVATVDHTPFTDNLGAGVGFINVPWEENLSRSGVAPANNIENDSGRAFFAATYLGPRSAFTSPDEPHSASTVEPYVTGPGGVTLIRLSILLKPAAAGQLVNLDLTNAVTPGNDYVTLTSASGTEEVVAVPEANLADGFIAVAPATCNDAPAAGSTATPASSTRATATPTPPPGTLGVTQTAQPTPAPADDGTAPSDLPTSGTSPAPQGSTSVADPSLTPAVGGVGSETPRPSDDDSAEGRLDDGGSDGGSVWLLVGIAGAGTLALAGAAGLVWRWRSR